MNNSNRVFEFTQDQNIKEIIKEPFCKDKTIANDYNYSSSSSSCNLSKRSKKSCNISKDEIDFESSDTSSLLYNNCIPNSWTISKRTKKNFRSFSEKKMFNPMLTNYFHNSISYFSIKYISRISKSEHLLNRLKSYKAYQRLKQFSLKSKSKNLTDNLDASKINKSYKFIKCNAKNKYKKRTSSFINNHSYKSINSNILKVESLSNKDCNFDSNFNLSNINHKDSVSLSLNSKISNLNLNLKNKNIDNKIENATNNLKNNYKFNKSNFYKNNKDFSSNLNIDFNYLDINKNSESLININYNKDINKFNESLNELKIIQSKETDYNCNKFVNNIQSFMSSNCSSNAILTSKENSKLSNINNVTSSTKYTANFSNKSKITKLSGNSSNRSNTLTHQNTLKAKNISRFVIKEEGLGNESSECDEENAKEKDLINKEESKEVADSNVNKLTNISNRKFDECNIDYINEFKKSNTSSLEEDCHSTYIECNNVVNSLSKNNNCFKNIKKTYTLEDIKNKGYNNYNLSCSAKLNESKFEMFFRNSKHSLAKDISVVQEDSYVSFEENSAYDFILNEIIELCSEFPLIDNNNYNNNKFLSYIDESYKTMLFNKVINKFDINSCKIPVFYNEKDLILITDFSSYSNIHILLTLDYMLYNNNYKEYVFNKIKKNSLLANYVYYINKHLLFFWSYLNTKDSLYCCSNYNLFIKSISNKKINFIVKSTIGQEAYNKLYIKKLSFGDLSQLCLLLAIEDRTLNDTILMLLDNCSSEVKNEIFNYVRNYIINKYNIFK